MNKLYDCLIIGAGPSGISLAIDLKNKGIDVAIVEKSAPGGKVNIAPRIDNFPPFKEIPGPELAKFFYQKLKEDKIEIIYDEVLDLSKDNDIFILKCEFDTLYSKTVYIASGTNEEKLHLENEDKFFAHGISYCAICDGHFYRNKTAMVVGKDNIAFKEALYLVKLVKTLYFVNRDDCFTADEFLVNELKSCKNVVILMNYSVEELIGEDYLTSVKVTNKETKEEKTLQIDGLFPLIGQIPNTYFISNKIILDDNQNIIANKNGETSIPGLFSGGDVISKDIRLISLAVKEAKQSEESILNYLAKL